MAACAVDGCRPYDDGEAQYWKSGSAQPVSPRSVLLPKARLGLARESAGIFRAGHRQGLDVRAGVRRTGRYIHALVGVWVHATRRRLPGSETIRGASDLLRQLARRGAQLVGVRRALLRLGLGDGRARA